MANTNMTKREVLNAIVEALNNAVTNDAGDIALVDFEPKVIDEVKAYALNEINLLDKKAASAKNVQSKTQKENEGIKEIILDVLNEQEDNKPITVGELIKDVRLTEKDVSNQKASALLRQLVEAGTVFKITDKKRSLFTTKAPENEEDSAE